MNAPERIKSLLIAPGVVLLNPGARVDMDARSKAAAAILKQMRHAKPSPKGESGQDYLARARERHVR